MVVVLSQLLRHTDNLGNSLKKIIPTLKRIIFDKSKVLFTRKGLRLKFMFVDASLNWSENIKAHKIDKRVPGTQTSVVSEHSNMIRRYPLRGGVKFLDWDLPLLLS